MKTQPASVTSTPPHAVLIALLAMVIVVVLGAPVSAQYGGGPGLFVTDPTPPIGETVDLFGDNCPPGSTVTLTIDGFPGVVATTTADADGLFFFDDVELPASAVPGQDLVFRSECGGETSTVVVSPVCADGSDPVDGCDTTVPDGGSNGGNGGIGNGNGNGDGATPGSGSDDNLAFTGLSGTALILQFGVTLLGLGAVVLLLARNRRRVETV